MRNERQKHGGIDATGYTRWVAQGGDWGSLITHRLGQISPDGLVAALIPALQKALSIRGYWLAEIVTNPERLARAKSYVYDRVKTGQLKPKIAKTFRFEDAAEAYQYMESNEQIGKIVLTVGE
jgi:NADPH:quinone reductase-like Zn-dependent oxidoreductase